MPPRPVCRPLRLVPDTAIATRRVLVPFGKPPVVASEDGRRHPAWACGACGATLIVGVPLEDLWDGVVRCPTCRSHNALAPGDVG
jgi:hypothetical protein